jgi:hypothetical protein
MKPIENFNVFSKPDYGVAPSELATILAEIPSDVMLAVDSHYNLNLIRAGEVVGKVYLTNKLGFSGLDRLATSITLPQVTVSTVEAEGTGGTGATFNATTKTFSGTIDYYDAEHGGGGNPLAGNYVGVKITAPEGVTVNPATATFTYINAKGQKVTLVNGVTPWLDGDNYVLYYPYVNTRRVFEITIDWDGTGTTYKPETIVITVADNATLTPAG